MMRSWKRVLACLCTLCLLLSLFAMPAMAEGGEKVQIRLMGYNTEASRKTYLDLLAKQFPNIEVIFEFVSNDNFNNILNTQLQAGNGPDIIEMGAATSQLVNAGYLMDLTDEEFTSKFTDTGLMTFTVNDRVYAQPLQSWFEGIFYNKAIFREHGLEVPHTYDEYLAIQEALLADGVKPQAVSAGFWETLSKMSVGYMDTVFYDDPENFEFDRKFDVGEASLAETWLPYITDWCGKLFDSGLITQDMLGINYDQALDEFATEKAAMWQCGPWAVPVILEKNPDIELGMFPIPTQSGSTGWLLGGPGSAWAVNAKTEHRDEVMEILNFTATPEAQAALIADNTGSSYMKGVDVDLGEIYADCSEAFSEGHVYANFVSTWTFGTSLMETWGKSLQEVLAGTKTIEQALQDVDDMNAILRENMED